MVNYSKGKIYKIVDNTSDNIYIGSTVKTLAQRLGQHKANYKNFLEGKYHYVSSYKILENGDYNIILLEEVINCENKDQLNARERYYIDNLNCVNKVRPGRTKLEYYEENKDKILDQKKQYYEENKDKILDQKKQYYEENNDKILEKLKFYYTDNKEKIQKRKKQSYEINKEAINAQRKSKINCSICNCMVRKDGFKEHEQSIKHQNNIKKQLVI